MLAYEDESARHLFAVYVRPEGERGTINFYADEAAAVATMGAGEMRESVQGAVPAKLDVATGKSVMDAK